MCLLGAAPLVNYPTIQLSKYPTIQLSKYPTTQLLKHPLYKWGLNNILRLLWIKQAHYTFNGMWVGETNYPDTSECLTQNQETLLASEAEGYHYHNHNHNYLQHYRHQIRRKGQRSKICRAVWHKRAGGEITGLKCTQRNNPDQETKRPRPPLSHLTNWDESMIVISRSYHDHDHHSPYSSSWLSEADYTVAAAKNKSGWYMLKKLHIFTININIILGWTQYDKSNIIVVTFPF